MNRIIKHLFATFTPIVGIVLMLLACASPGSPDGGQFDETPPKVVGTFPAERSVGSNSNKLVIAFDEFIKLNNASEKVVISPPQLNMPEIKANGKKINIKLVDSLQQNTTYTVDFSDAIEDNNEGNPLGNYVYTFSTGSSIDTMEVSGNVLEASNLEPIKGMLVGLHSNLADTAFCKKPFERVARTNGSGRFVIKGVAPGSYRIYALADADGNFCFNQKSEKIAFSKGIIVPSSRPDVRPDTLWADSTHIDTIKHTPFTHFLPDDIVLRAFTELQTQRHLLKTERATPYVFKLFFTASSEKTPTIKGLNFDEKNAFIVQTNTTNDTISYWLNNEELLKQDTLSFALTYDESNDSTGIRTDRTDTLDLVPRTTYAKLQKQKDDRLKKWTEEQEKLKKKGKSFSQTPPPDYLELKYSGSGALNPDKNIVFTMPEPLEKIDTNGIHLRLKKDTLWVDAPFEFEQSEEGMNKYVLRGEWRAGQSYKVELDSATFTSIYGKVNRKLDFSVQIPMLEIFGSLFVNLQGLLPSDSCVVVQLLNSTGKKINQVQTRDGRADFFFLRPGDYNLSAFIDSNQNGIWDTGEYEKNLQPEELFYYPRAITIRARWDISQDWNLRELPLTKQKPDLITKQKPDIKKTIKNRNLERLRNQ